MATAPAAPWKLQCPYCPYPIIVNARGMRGSDMGSGFQAAEIMETHVFDAHDKTWEQALEAMDAKADTLLCD